MDAQYAQLIQNILTSMGALQRYLLDNNMGLMLERINHDVTRYQGLLASRGTVFPDARTLETPNPEMTNWS